MNENLRKKIVYSILPIAIIWAGYNLKSSDDKESSTNNYATIQEITKTKTTEPNNREKLAQEYDSKDWGLDPFHTIVKKQAVRKQKIHNKPTWKLTGIMYNSNNPLAVINKKYVGEGEKVGSGKVISIEKEKVIIEYNGRQYTLRVSKG